MRLQQTFNYIKDPKRLPDMVVYLLGIVFVGLAYSVNTALQLILLLLTAACYVFLITELLSIIQQNKAYFKKSKNDLFLSFIASLLITIIDAFLLKTILWGYVLGLSAALIITTQLILFTRRPRN